MDASVKDDARVEAPDESGASASPDQGEIMEMIPVAWRDL